MTWEPIATTLPDDTAIHDSYRAAQTRDFVVVERIGMPMIVERRH